MSQHSNNITTVMFYGIDSWNRPVFKDKNTKAFYGSLSKLFDYSVTKEEVENNIIESDLTYFGTFFDCEPDGASVEILKIERL